MVNGITRAHFTAVLWIFLRVIFSSASVDITIITAESGQNVNLTCRAPNNNTISVVKWTKTDLKCKYVFLYQDGHFVSDEQHPFFKNRVDLQDRQMKDGDVSLILKDVTINDTGTYECRVAQREPNQKRSNLKLISIINLGVGRGRYGLIASGLLLFGLIVALAITSKLSKKKLSRNLSNHLSSDESADSCSENTALFG